MKNKNFEVYLDLGSSKIRAAAINNSNLLNNYYYESNFFNDYLNSENEIEKIITNLEKDTNEYLDSIYLMVDSPLIKTISLSISNSFDGSQLKKENFQFLIQDAKQQILKNYSDLNIIHIVIKNYKIDNVDYTFLPHDVNYNSLSIDIIFICLPKEFTQDLKKRFSKLDVSINQIFCSSYLKSLSYKDNFTSVENISFIDIGYNKTSIMNYYNNKINFFHVIPVGSNHITKDLSKILKIDLLEAEEIKLYFDKDENILNEKKISPKLVQQIIFARIEEILELCAKYIKSNQDFNESSKLVLMGEGSRILDNKFKENISFLNEIDLLEETNHDICESVSKFIQRTNKQDVVIIPKKLIKKGFFEKLFHFFP